MKKGFAFIITMVSLYAFAFGFSIIDTPELSEGIGPKVTASKP